MKYYKLKYFYECDEIEGYFGFNINFNPTINNIEKFGFTTRPYDFTQIEDLKADFVLDKSIESINFDFDFVKSMDTIILGSKEFCQILKLFEPNFHFIDAFGYSNDKIPLIKEYEVIHIGYSLDVFDYRNSEYDGKPLALSRIQNNKKPPLIKNISNLRLNIDKVGNSHFFFLKNTLLNNPIISSKLKEAFDKKGLKLEYEIL